MLIASKAPSFYRRLRDLLGRPGVLRGCVGRSIEDYWHRGGQGGEAGTTPPLWKKEAKIKVGEESWADTRVQNRLGEGV